jgi:uncharacterized protein YyaL (SSP411 family)
MTNKLAQSTSPYLQQHAENPVHWHEWGEEALALAKATGKPILLSVGYSACHWCHVMAHESFEDAQIAAVMNEQFVNIKVDREERPDIDQVYQTAHAMLTQRSGGWPLTMFLTPDTTPFFGGTYFPRIARYGLPGFGELLMRVAGYHRERGEEIREQNRQLMTALNAPAGLPPADAAELQRDPIDAARRQMLDAFDARRGGFGGAPKFPHPEMLEFCLRRFAESADTEARHAVCHTLEQMCKGGIFDQLGGGFSRYSVDTDWAIPHFEKMLYDNGPLLRLLADAWLVAENAEQKALFARSVEETAAWVMREMQSPAGGYYSTLDADSEGHEGKFYVWTPATVRALLGVDEWRVVERHYGLDRPANFEGAWWHLNIGEPLAGVANAIDLPLAQCEGLLASARATLFAHREQRIHPGRDEKILTSWNALMIEGMAHAGRILGRAEWIASARRARDFIGATLWKDHRLLATHKDGKTHLNAYLDDYACLLKALIELQQADYRVEDIAFTQAIADVLLAQFEDTERGGFFFTSHDHEPLIQRPKPAFDNATPSGNGVAAFALQRLAHLTGEMRYETAARRTLACFYAAMEHHPSGHGSLLMALEESLNPPRLLILTGPQDAMPRWQQMSVGRYLPDLLMLTIPDGASASAGLPAVLQRPASPTVNAWLCQGVSCLPPIADIAQLQALLKRPIVPAVASNNSTM